MKKSKILAAVLLLAMFSSVFGLATTATTVQIGSSVADTPSTDYAANDLGLGDALGENGTWVADLVDLGETITYDDADYSDWADLPNFEILNGVNISVAFDATYVYMLVSWADTTNDIEVGQWNKTGLVNDDFGEWDFVDGSDDVLQVGFGDGTDIDMMVWCASNRTVDNYMFEGNSTQLDTGTLPYEMNTNTTGTFEDAQPEWEDDDFTVPLPVDATTIANGTMVNAWLDDFPTVPTGSQANTEIAVDWNTTMVGGYFAEIRRALDTGEADDIVLDFSTELTFYLGVANGDGTFDMFIDVDEYLCCLTNEQAYLTFTTIPNADLVTEALVITGGMYDDYAGYDLTVHLQGWDDTYAAGHTFDITVNEATGNYSFLFFFDEFDMPLGTHYINVTLSPLYGDDIMLNQTIEIDDIKAPNIEGIVDLQDRYPDGVPLDEDYAVITVGLADDYCANDDISAYLYHYQGNDVALKTDMVQFSPGSTTFVANLTIDHAPGVVNNYTYFVQAWDTNLNKVTSERFWVLSISAAPTPAFGIIAGLFGLAGAAFIVKKLKK